MPDITYNIIGNDQLTPKLNQTTQAMASLNAQAKAGGQDLVDLGRKIYDALGKIPGMTFEKAKGMVGAPDDLAALDAYQKKLQQTADTLRQLRAGGGGGGPTGGTDVARDDEGGGGGLGRMMASFTRSFLVFHVLREAINQVAQDLKQIGADMQGYQQWANLVGQANMSAATSFQQLGLAALEAGTTRADISKRAAGFTMLGANAAEAKESATTAAKILRDTGQELDNAGERAKYYGASIQDALKMGDVEAGQERPGLQREALEAYQFENTRKFREMEIRERQQAESDDLEDRQRNNREAFEDTYHGINRAREERHRAANYALEDENHAQQRTEALTEKGLTREMEDRHKAERRQVEDTDHAINREMELRHQAANYQMEDLHRIAQRAQEDRATERSERAEAAGGFVGAAEAVATGTGQMKFRDPRTGKMRTMAVPPEIWNYYQQQFAAGAEEMGRVTGIAPGAIRTLMAQGAVSPGAVLGMAGRVEERRDLQATRAREDESRQQARSQTAERQIEAERQYRENQEMNRRQADESQAQQRALADLREQAAEDRYIKDRDQRRAQQKEDVDAGESQYQDEKTRSRLDTADTVRMQRGHRRENQEIAIQSLGYQKDLNEGMAEAWDRQRGRLTEDQVNLGKLLEKPTIGGVVTARTAEGTVETQDKLVAGLITKLLQIFQQ